MLQIATQLLLNMFPDTLDLAGSKDKQLPLGTQHRPVYAHIDNEYNSQPSKVNKHQAIRITREFNEYY